jgi:hypothetical protein
MLVGKPEGKRSFGRQRTRWVDDISVDFGEIWLEGVDWIHLAPDRPVGGSCEGGNKPSRSTTDKFLDQPSELLFPKRAAPWF